MSAAIRKAVLKLRPALLSDALGKSGGMDHGIHCYSKQPRMAGPAFTVRIHKADILMVGKALSLCPSGHVLVIDGRAEPDTALWGGITTSAAEHKKLAGIVIDGAVRDVAEIRGSKLPVFARGNTPQAGGAEYKGETQVPVVCGGVVVSPGDWISSDEDGVVAIPASKLEAAIELAGRIAAIEKVIHAQVRAGKDLATLLRFDEVLATKVGIPQLRALPKD
ncbi:MAG: RraA family protein [Acidobacteria bacterium]|nr:RraA family protein [Acidobacteriota bacterium]